MYFKVVIVRLLQQIRLSQNNGMEILTNEPNQASVSDITTSQYDDDYIISCTPIPATMESYIDQSCLYTTLSLETDLKLVVKYNSGLKTLHIFIPLQGISEPILNGDLVYQFKRIVGKPFFSDQFKKIIKD